MQGKIASQERDILALTETVKNLQVRLTRFRLELFLGPRLQVGEGEPESRKREFAVACAYSAGIASAVGPVRGVPAACAGKGASGREKCV